MRGRLGWAALCAVLMVGSLPAVGAGAQAGTDPAESEPGTDPAESEPGTDPAESEPGTDPTESEPGTDPTEPEPGTDTTEPDTGTDTTEPDTGTGTDTTESEPGTTPELDDWEDAAETDPPSKQDPVDDRNQTRSDHDDTDSQPSGAVDLGDVTGLGVKGPTRAGRWNGVLDGRNESVDYFTFTLTAERMVAVALSNMGADADLFLEQLEADSSLTVLASSTNVSNSQEMLNAVLFAGTYYVRVETERGRKFNYTLTMGTTSPRADDPVSDFTTAAVVDMDSCFEAPDGAKIAPYWDLDWIRVELVAGEDYVLEVRGLGAGAGSLTDPELLAMYVDPNGSLYAMYESVGRAYSKGTGRISDNGLAAAYFDQSSPLYDATLASLIAAERNRKYIDAYDLDDGAGNDAWMLFRAAATGSHYIKVGSSGGFQGTYVVAAASAADAPASCAKQPGRPRAVRAEPVNDTTVKMEWDPPDDGGAPIVGYDVEYRSMDAQQPKARSVPGAAEFAPGTKNANAESDEDDWTLWGHVADPNQQSVLVDGLAPDTEYEFRVRAVNDVGEGSWSDEPTEQDPIAAPTVAATLPPGQGNHLPMLVNPISPIVVDENSTLDVLITAIDPDAEDGPVAIVVTNSVPTGAFSVTSDDRLVSAGVLDHEGPVSSVTLELTSGMIVSSRPSPRRRPRTCP